MTLIQLIVERGPDAVNALPKGIRKNQEAVAETIENNVRKLIINESPVDPAYYEKMSKLLDALIEQRRKGMLSYKEYLEKIAKLTKEATMPGGGPGGYPASVRTAAQRALYNNLDRNEGLALAVDAAIQGSRQDGWKDNPIKMKRVRNAIKAVLEKAPTRGNPASNFSIAEDVSDAFAIDSRTTRILELAKHQHDY
jgi:type I restriction enzyme R subunit